LEALAERYYKTVQTEKADLIRQIRDLEVQINRPQNTIGTQTEIRNRFQNVVNYLNNNLPNPKQIISAGGILALTNLTSG
jgi:hypothetical protein